MFKTLNVKLDIEYEKEIKSKVREIENKVLSKNSMVYQVRDELEHLVDDNDDMAEMYLTDKLDEQLESSSVSMVDEQDEADIDDRHVFPTNTSISSKSLTCHSRSWSTALMLIAKK